MSVFDASALLAYLGGEPGSDVVERALDEGGLCGTGNWSEVAGEGTRGRPGLGAQSGTSARFRAKS